ncbi:MAG: septum site-determining protein MinD [Muribaculaceae bacterium]|nr:septum site-determining protein MinD [Roseburia sp.]MCM1430947.1 septum site-determining protein MinD [Muribaculaceae bacterium]MCM1493895.1 septum site-determining protein MinD [Muribaculaceae bacterium]
MGEAIVFTSGKGGVGKTTTIANIGAGLSRLDKKVVMLDADMGLRNLDVVMGMEDQIQYNLIDLLENQCRLKQALIRDKRYPNLYMIPAALKHKPIREYESKLYSLIGQLKQEFDYCLIDCPAGIEDGFHFAVSAADRAVLVTTPHISAVRDAARVLFLLENLKIRQTDVIINEYNERMVKKHEMMSKEDVTELLGIPCLGVIPVDDKIIVSQNQGIPVLSLRAKSGRSFLKAAREIDNPRVIPQDLNAEDPCEKKKNIYVSGEVYGYET